MFSTIFEANKKNVQGILVLHLVEISREFLIFIDLKITETRFTTIHNPLVTFEHNHFVRSICATRAREHFKLWAHLFIHS